MDDMINQLNQQYEEVDSKETVKEEKIDLNEILKANEITEKWLDEEREFQKNSKDDNFSKDAFTKKRSSSYEKKEEKKEEKRSSYGYYKSSEDEKKSSYSSKYSSSSSSKKSSDDIFYEKVENAFIEKVNKMVDGLFDKNLNKIEHEGEWDMLDLQYELNRKRITDRDYEDKIITKEFNKAMEKHSNSCSRKVDIAELMILLKVNPHRY